FVKEELTWEGAQRRCTKWGATLTNIPDQKTDDALRSFLFGRLVGVGFHIGLRYTYKPPSPKGEWRWPDGSMPDYTNWETGQAQLAFGKCAEASLDAHNDGRWRNTDCTSTKRSAVCELPPWSTLKSGDGGVEKPSPALPKPDEPKPDYPSNGGTCTDHGPDCATSKILCDHR
ncbi:secretory phospholipase A2 receptor, partial [Aphelenchoides avenae]